MNEEPTTIYLDRIAALFAYGLPEHEQKNRLNNILREVYTLGQQNPITKTNGDGVTVRKAKRK